MNLDPKQTVAFSGHRILSAIERDIFSHPSEKQVVSEYHLRNKLLNAITELYGQGYRYFLCGMAMGFDLMAGEVVLEAARELPGIKLIAVVPYPGQTARFSAEDKIRYGEVANSSWRRILISPRYSYDCFHRRNDYMVDHASALICFYNGSKGGTAYTVKRALAAGLRVINML